jgi:hypothetical protein
VRKTSFYLNKYNDIIHNNKLIPKTVNDNINTMVGWKRFLPDRKTEINICYCRNHTVLARSRVLDGYKFLSFDVGYSLK